MAVKTGAAEWPESELNKLESMLYTGGVMLGDADFALVQKIRNTSLRDRIRRTMHSIKRDWAAMVESIRRRKPLPWDEPVSAGPRVEMPHLTTGLTPGGGGGGGGSSTTNGGTSNGASSDGGRAPAEDEADAMLDQADDYEYTPETDPGAAPDGSGTPLQPWQADEGEPGIDWGETVKGHFERYWLYWAIGGVVVAGVGGYLIFRK